MVKLRPLTPLQQQTIAEAAYTVLGEHILNGGYRPGERLKVKEIAQELQISATPVRSALAILAREGLVHINPRSGTHVTPLDLRDLDDVLTVRKALELLAAETALTRATASDLVELDHLVERVRRSRSVTEHYHFNARFHSALVELSGNRTLIEMYRQLHAHLRVALIHARSDTWRNRVQLEAEEHMAIVSALKQRDTNAALDAVNRHCSRTASALVAELKQLESTED
jgi:DNA-binding GntR family transcriptional regulator